MKMSLILTSVLRRKGYEMTKKMAKHGKKILRNKSANSLLFSVLSIFGFMKKKSKSQDVCNYTEKEI